MAMPYGLLGGMRPQQGLLHPVMWDRVRQARGLGTGLLGTEGVRGPYGGGGRTTVTPEAAEAPKFRWSYSGGQHTTTTKSGVRIIVDKGYGGDIDVSFWNAGPRTPGERPSMKRAMSRFEDVYLGLKDYLKKHPNVEEINFSG